MKQRPISARARALPLCACCTQRARAASQSSPAAAIWATAIASAGLTPPAAAVDACALAFMRSARMVEAIAQAAELGQKARLIIQTPQVEDERPVIEMADDRQRQLTKGIGECRKAPTRALALDRSDDQRRARSEEHTSELQS